MLFNSKVLFVSYHIGAKACIMKTLFDEIRCDFHTCYCKDLVMHFSIWMKYNIDTLVWLQRCLVDELGNYTDEAGNGFAGKHVFEDGDQLGKLVVYYTRLSIVNIQKHVWSCFSFLIKYCFPSIKNRQPVTDVYILFVCPWVFLYH